MNFAFAMVTSLLVTLSASAAGMPRIIQAETAQLDAGAQRIEEPRASGGAGVQLMPHGRATWTVDSQLAGRYELTIRYRTAQASIWATFEINGQSRGLGLTATFGDWYESRIIVPLVAGPNTLAIKALAADFTIDHLRFTSHPRVDPAPIYELPVISPRQATIDLRQPRDQVFLLRQNGHGSPTLRLGDRTLPTQSSPFAHVDDAVFVTIPRDALATLPVGDHVLQLTFDDRAEINVPLRVTRESLAAPLLIATLEVNHGKSTVIRLPDGQVAVIDCGKAEYGASRVVPFLAAHGIKHVDHLFITHYHDDHVGGADALRQAVSIGTEHDYTSHRVGDRFELGGVSWFVLNAYESGDEENTRSLSLQLNYKGFVYTDGADTYGQNQVVIAEKFPDRVRSHVVYGNHHFHGSVDVNYLRRTDAVLFLVSADPAVYARAAFTDHFKREVETYLKANDGRCRETLLTAEVGNILVRVHDAGHWSYETAPVGAVFSDFARAK